MSELTIAEQLNQKVQVNMKRVELLQKAICMIGQLYKQPNWSPADLYNLNRDIEIDELKVRLNQELLEDIDIDATEELIEKLREHLSAEEMAAIESIADQLIESYDLWNTLPLKENFPFQNRTDVRGIQIVNKSNLEKAMQYFNSREHVRNTSDFATDTIFVMEALVQEVERLGEIIDDMQYMNWREAADKEMDENMDALPNGFGETNDYL